MGISIRKKLQDIACTSIVKKYCCVSSWRASVETNRLKIKCYLHKVTDVHRKNFSVQFITILGNKHYYWVNDFWLSISDVWLQHEIGGDYLALMV